MIKRILSLFVLFVIGFSSAASAQEDPLTHFGQDVVLSGANVAWINFGSDVGGEQSTAQDLQGKFVAMGPTSYKGTQAQILLTAAQDQTGLITPAPRHYWVLP